MITDFILAEEAKELLKKPMGSLISEIEFKKLDASKLITVGDVVTLKAFEHNLVPKLCIFDHVVEREPFKDKNLLGTPDFTTQNEAGQISLAAWNTIKEALEKDHAKILVDGEEDLLTLAALFQAPVGFTVVYGQPGEGMVLVEVTEREKQKWAEVLIQTKAREFLHSLKGKTVILHDDDADGGSAAVQFKHYFDEQKLEAVTMPTNDATIHAPVAQEVENEEPANVIMLDFGVEARDRIKHMSGHMNIMIVDHHKVWEFPDFGKAIYLNPHLFNVPDDFIAPTSGLAYTILKREDWKAAIGVIADKGFNACADLLESVKEKYNVDFDHLKDLINAADSMGDPGAIVEVLCAAGKPEDVLNNAKLNEYHEKITVELNALVAEHDQKGEWFRDKLILFYEIASERMMRGAVANALQKRYPDKIVIIGEREKDHFYMSFRTMRDDVDMVPPIKEAIQSMEDANGGGHSKACGAKVLVSDKEEFVKRFLENLKSE